MTVPLDAVQVETHPLHDHRVLGPYAGLTPEQAAAKLLHVHDGHRERARKVASRRAYDHPETVVRKWWEQVAVAIEVWREAPEWGLPGAA